VEVHRAPAPADNVFTVEVGSADFLLSSRGVSVSTPCHYCRRTGLVRVEKVIAKGMVSRHFYCGACDRTWQVADDQGAPPQNCDAQRPRKPTSRT
jgi:transposase-like protein